MGATTREQTSFRIRDDDGSEAAATWRQLINIDDTLLVDNNYRIRFGYTIAEMDASTVCQLEYNLAGAGWNNVTAASSVVRSSASPNVADNATITEQLDQGKTFTANITPTGGFDEVDGAVSSQDLTTTQECEVEFCFQIRSADVVDAQTLQLKITSGGTDFTTYTNTPTITVDESVDTSDIEFAGTLTQGQQEPRFPITVLIVSGLCYVAAVNAPFDWNTTLSEPISIAQYQYQAHVAPLEPIAPAETITLDKWYASLSEPVLPKDLLTAAQQASSGSLEPLIGRDLLGWYFQSPHLHADDSPLYFLTAGAQPTGARLIETEFVDEWWRPLSEPVPPKAGLHASQQQAFFVDANLAAIPSEDITLDKWFRPLSEPVSPKASLVTTNQQAYFGSLEPLTPRDLIGWHVALSEPPLRLGLDVSQQKAFFGDLEPIVAVAVPDFGWYVSLSIPVLTKDLPTAQQQAFTMDANISSISVVTAVQTYIPTFRPRRRY